jgi:hypothetical protein
MANARSINTHDWCKRAPHDLADLNGLASWWGLNYKELTMSRRLTTGE